MSSFVFVISFSFSYRGPQKLYKLQAPLNLDPLKAVCIGAAISTRSSCSKIVLHISVKCLSKRYSCPRRDSNSHFQQTSGRLRTRGQRERLRWSIAAHILAFGWFIFTPKTVVVRKGANTIGGRPAPELRPAAGRGEFFLTYLESNLVAKHEAVSLYGLNSCCSFAACVIVIAATEES